MRLGAETRKNPVPSPITGCAGKSILVRLLTHEDRAIAPDDGNPPVRVFGNGNWHVFELRQRLGIVSADLHQRFVAGNSEGRISAEAAVLSGFLASDGILRYGAITDPTAVPHIVNRVTIRGAS